MNTVLNEIYDKLITYQKAPSFSEAIFGHESEIAISPKSKIYIFGAGQLGKMLAKAFSHAKIGISGFLDNDPEKQGLVIEDLPCYPLKHIQESLDSTHVVISIDLNSDEAEIQLLASGLREHQIHFGRTKRLIHGKHIKHYLSNCLCGCLAWTKTSELTKIIERDIDIISEIYHKLADENSRQILTSRIALSLSGETYGALNQFLQRHSDTVIENTEKYGSSWYSPMSEPEFKYYFQQDFLAFHENEVFVDVGAEDGNTIVPFIDHLHKNNLKPKKIYAFEPDPASFRILRHNVEGIANIIIENSGIGAENSKLKFKKSTNFGSHRHCGRIDPDGDIVIDIHSIDSYFKNRYVSFLKFDPNGNVIIGCLIGASNTISLHKPKIIAGIYHSIENIYKIPKILLDLNPSYKIYIRHLAFHANETHAFAI
jgi:FkbM family methyltransferase